ncbi:MAG: hypothetical protein NVS2B12_27680 [Ktedonobacteraceae bacterium]
MIQSPQNLRLNLKILDSLRLLCRGHHGKTHLFHGAQMTLVLHIFRQIDSTHATLTNHFLDVVASVEYGAPVQIAGLCFQATVDCEPPSFVYICPGYNSCIPV